MQHELDAQLASLPDAVREEMEVLVSDGAQWRERIERRGGWRNDYLVVEWCPAPRTGIVQWRQKIRDTYSFIGHAPEDRPVAGTTEMLLNFATAASFRQFLIMYMRFQLLFTHYRPGEQHAQVEAPEQPKVDQPLPRNTVDAD